MLKQCYTCKESKALDLFHKDKKRPDGKLPSCKSCQKAKVASYAKKEPEKYRAIRTRAGRVHKLKKFGLTVESYLMLKNAQNGLCELCNRAPRGGIELSLDHDHKTGKFRGLLCQDCNRGLGMFLDNPVVLKKAAEYLTAPKGEYI